MPEGVGYASSNVTAGTGLELNYVGNHCYAYSGTQTVSAEAKTVLSFTTGKKYILAKVEISFDVTGLGTGEDIGYQVKLNGLEVVDHDLGSNVGNSQWVILPVTLLIPPFTNFVGILSTSDGSNINMGMTLTGKLYG